MDVSFPGYAVIVDLVGSRAQPDRAAAQQQLELALAAVNDVVDALQPLAPTISQAPAPMPNRQSRPSGSTSLSNSAARRADDRSA
jgi:hypothetical protein